MDGFHLFLLWTVVVFGGAYSLGYSLGTPEIQKEAIQRGYALHCPSSGQFAWKNECEVNK